MAKGQDQGCGCGMGPHGRGWCGGGQGCMGAGAGCRGDCDDCPRCADPDGTGKGCMGCGRAQGAGYGAGGDGVGPGLRACNMGGAPLDEAARSAVESALADERRAEARYSAALQELGSAPPLSNVSRAEGRHAWALEQLLRSHGNAVPESKAQTGIPRFGSATAACRDGQEVERQNIALYDKLLKASLPADVKCVFEHLRMVSKDRHLPAFTRCVGAP